MHRHAPSNSIPNLPCLKEFCSKGILSDAVAFGWFRRRGSLYDLDYSFIFRTAKEVAGAMAYLHSMDLLHLDLTGSNILLCASDVDERGFIAKVNLCGASKAGVQEPGIAPAWLLYCHLERPNIY